MGTALQPAFIGVALGAIGAVIAGRLLASLLFAVAASDVLAWSDFHVIRDTGVA